MTSINLFYASTPGYQRQGVFYIRSDQILYLFVLKDSPRMDTGAETCSRK